MQAGECAKPFSHKRISSSARSFGFPLDGSKFNLMHRPITPPEKKKKSSLILFNAVFFVAYQRKSAGHTHQETANTCKWNQHDVAIFNQIISNRFVNICSIYIYPIYILNSLISVLSGIAANSTDDRVLAKRKKSTFECDVYAIGMRAGISDSALSRP